jgi:hypothetical protein
MGFQELLGFVKAQAQKFAHLALRELAGALAIERKDFQGAAQGPGRKGGE